MWLSHTKEQLNEVREYLYQKSNEYDCARANVPS